MRKTIFLCLLFTIATLFCADYSYFGHIGAIWQIAFFAGELYSIGADGTVRTWSPDLFIKRVTTSNFSWTRSLFVNEMYMITGGYKPDNKIRIWDRKSVKLLVELSGHSGSIFSIWANEKYLVTAGSDNSVILWKDFKVFKTLKHHESWVRKAFIFGEYIVSGDDSGYLNFVYLKDFKLAKQIKLDSQIVGLTFYKNSIYCSTAGGFLYKIENLNVVKKVKLSDRLNGLDTMVIDGKPYVVSFSIGQAFLTDSELKLVKNFSVSIAELTAVTSDGKFLYFSDMHGEIHKYTFNGEYVKKTGYYQYGNVVFSIHSNNIAIARGKNLEIFDVKTGVKLGTKTFDEEIKSLIFKNDGSIIIGTVEGSIYFLNKNLIILKVFRFNDSIVHIKDYLGFTIASTYRKVIFFDGNLKSSQIDIGSDWITDTEMIGNSLYLSTNDGRILKYENSSITELWNFNEPIVQILKFENDSYFVSLQGKVFKGFSKLVKSFSKNTFCAEYSQVQKSVFLGVEKSLSLLDGTEISRFESEITKIESFEDSLVISLSNGEVLVVKSGKIVRRFTSLESLQATSIETSDKILAVGFENGTVVLADKNGNFLYVLADHRDAVQDTVFVGNFLVSSSKDKSIKIWDIRNGELVRTLADHSSYVWSLGLTNDKKYLVSADWNGNIFVWDADGWKVIKKYKIPHSVTEIYALSSEMIFLSTLEGSIVKIEKDSITKRAISKDSLWSLDYNGKEILTGGWDGNIYLLSKDLSTVKILKAHNSTVFRVMFLNGKFLTAGSDNAIKIFENQKIVKTITDFKLSVLTIAIDKTQRRIITWKNGLIFINF